MKFTLISLFPQIVADSIKWGVVGQAQTKKIFEFESINPREFTEDIHKSVDDRPIGGGDGMVMLSEPLQQAIHKAKFSTAQNVTTDASENFKSLVVHLTPQGKPLTTAMIRTEILPHQHIIILCGRYAGIDQRLIQAEVDLEISLGDFVLAGGEIAAAALIEATVRELPGVLGNVDSAVKDSFSNQLLEGPSWTRPRSWQDCEVPDILFTGNHKNISHWREMLAWLTTYCRRLDLFKDALKKWPEKDKQKLFTNLCVFIDEVAKTNAPESLGLKAPWSILKANLNQEFSRIGLPLHAPKIENNSSERSVYPRVSVGLIHHPVYDRKKSIVATNVTNFDIHDIARVCRVYGIENYYIIHPMKEQLMFVERVLDHWRTGYGSKFNPKRKEALGMVKTAENIQMAMRDWGAKDIQLIATSAKSHEGVPHLSFDNLRQQMWQENRNCFLVFGTGFGLTEEVFLKCNGILESIKGRVEGMQMHQDFRHLSVRSAVSIVLDRLLS